jgi:hypothetical protein
MICFAFDMPEKNERGSLVVVLILGKENLDRMKVSDPFDIKLKTVLNSSVQLNTPAKLVDFVIAYEEDEATIAKFTEERDIVGLVKWIERGRKIIPGDVQPVTKLRRQ